MVRFRALAAALVVRDRFNWLLWLHPFNLVLQHCLILERCPGSSDIISLWVDTVEHRAHVEGLNLVDMHGIAMPEPNV